jgi:hypothetical protein
VLKFLYFNDLPLFNIFFLCNKEDMGQNVNPLS